MIIQLNPPLPIITKNGPALAHLLIDEGIEHDLKWICFLDKNGECWTFFNRDIRAQKNITHGREYISPFYDPNEVALSPKKDCSYETHILHLKCGECGMLDMVLCKDAKEWQCERCSEEE